MKGKLPIALRVVAAIGALLLIDGGGMTDLLGILCLTVVLAV